MDLSACYGGEEFLTALSSCEFEGGLQFVERARAALRNVEFIAGPITVSACVASYHPGTTAPTDLLAAADQALYAAKQDGRDCVRVAAPLENPEATPAEPGLATS